MAHIEAPHRLSDAIEAFKTDLNGCLNTSGALDSLKRCLKQHFLAGQVGSQCRKSGGSSLRELAHCITAEYLESTQLKFTLPVFLSETCQSKQSNPAPTSQSVLEQLGISNASSFGRAFASYAPGHLHKSSQGNEESLLSGLLRTIELLHGIADEKERHQTVRGPTSETVKPEDQGLTQGPPMLYPDCEPSRHLVYHLKAASGLIRALRMELHTSQHLSGLLLRELYRAELDQGSHRNDAQSHVAMARRIASLQDTLLRQQKRVARLEKEEAALLQETDQPQAAPSAERRRLSSCADAQLLDSAGGYSISDASPPVHSSSTCPGCLSKRSRHARRTAGQQARPVQAKSGASFSTSSPPGSDACTEPCDSQLGERLGSACSSSAAAPLVPSSWASPTAWAAQADAQPPADGGTAAARQGAIKQTQPAAASAGLPTTHGHLPGAEGVDRDAGPGSIATISTESPAQTAFCKAPSGRQWEARTGHRSCSSSVPLQERVDEESHAHNQVIQDVEGAESTSSRSPGQHSTYHPPASRRGSLGSVTVPSEDAAALLQGAFPEPGTLGPGQGRQEANPSCTGSASDKEQRPAELSMSPSPEQLSPQPEHRRSNTGAAGSPSTEHSPSAWAGHSSPAALSPRTQHARNGGAFTTATQQAQAQSLAREVTESCDDDQNSISRDSATPAQERARGVRAGERQGLSTEEDELSRRMRSFLARLPDHSASARRCDSIGPASALSLQGSEGSSETGDGFGDEQAHEEGQGPSEECVALPGPGQAQLGRADVSRGNHDRFEPGIGCGLDVCTPAAPDAACSITVAAIGQTSTGIEAPADQGELPVPDTPKATVNPKTMPEGAAVASTLSVSPAYSMLPWDEPGMWSGIGDSMHSRDPQAWRHPTIAGTGALATASAAHTVPVAFMHQPSRLSVTGAGEEEPSSPEGVTSDTIPSSLRATHDSRWHMQTSEAASAQCHQHDGNISRAHLLGSTGSTNTSWARDPFANPPGAASVEHCQQGGTAAQPDLLSNAHHREATPPSSSAGGYQEHPHLSREAFVAELLGHMHCPLADSHLALPARDNAALEGPGQLQMDEPADQAAAWERHLGRTCNNGGSAEAEMQSSHHWLSMHGYSDAAVHVTATLTEAVKPPSTAKSDATRMKWPSPVSGPPPVHQKYTDSLPGAAQQSSTPCSLSISSNKNEGRPAADTCSALQTDVYYVRPGSPSSWTGCAILPAVLAAGNAQDRINVQGVALSRTMPSIWDLDM